MAIVRKCDNCGIYFSEGDAGGSIVIYDKNNYRDMHKDICPACRSVLLFIFGKYDKIEGTPCGKCKHFLPPIVRGAFALSVGMCENEGAECNFEEKEPEETKDDNQTV